jgi:L-ascorbate metabolism protein UlaG (beta-lactamase superfamily)
MREPAAQRLRRTAQVARSGLRRYPRVLRSALAEACRGGVRAEEAHLRESIREHARALAWLGHSSVLESVHGRTVLVDPVFSPRIGPRIGRVVLGPGRLCACLMDPAAIAGVDLVLITHAHFDHLDRPTLERLASKRTTVVTARRTRRLIPRGFARVVELDWDEEIEVEGVGVRALRPAHWGARIALDRWRGFNSYVVRDGGVGTLMAGDTAQTRAFDALTGIDVAVFGIGAYRPWVTQHATPEQVWSMFRASGARLLLPVHHSTFELSDEAPDEPRRRLLAAAGSEAHRIMDLVPGEVRPIELAGSA